MASASCARLAVLSANFISEMAADLVHPTWPTPPAEHTPPTDGAADGAWARAGKSAAASDAVASAPATAAAAEHTSSTIDGASNMAATGASKDVNDGATPSASTPWAGTDVSVRHGGTPHGTPPHRTPPVHPSPPLLTRAWLPTMAGVARYHAALREPQVAQTHRLRRLRECVDGLRQRGHGASARREQEGDRHRRHTRANGGSVMASRRRRRTRRGRRRRRREQSRRLV
jgi:hypothetical protein